MLHSHLLNHNEIEKNTWKRNTKSVFNVNKMCDSLPINKSLMPNWQPFHTIHVKKISSSVLQKYGIYLYTTKRNHTISYFHLSACMPWTIFQIRSAIINFVFLTVNINCSSNVSLDFIFLVLFLILILWSRVPIVHNNRLGRIAITESNNIFLFFSSSSLRPIACYSNHLFLYVLRPRLAESTKCPTGAFSLRYPFSFLFCYCIMQIVFLQFRS